MSEHSHSSASSKALAAAALGLLAICLLAAAAPPGGAPAGKSGTSAEPINITSERMEANSAGDMVTFTGNVVATQADGILKARVVKVFYRNMPAGEAKAAGGQPGQKAEPRREIVRIEADGDVVITQGNKVAVGEHGVYTAAERTIVLTGKPRVKQERDWVSGNRITFYLDEDRSLVESGPGRRVESTIYPKGEGQPQGGAVQSP